VVGNDIINVCGPTFPGRLRAAAGVDTAGLVTAYEAARQTLRFSEVWARVDKLDGKAPWAGQAALYRELVDILRGQTYWLARRTGKQSVHDLVAAYRPAVDTLKDLMPGVLSPFEQKAAVKRAAVWIKAGAPKQIAHSVALMRPLTLAVSVGDLARERSWPLAATAEIYHKVGGVFGFDRLRAAAASRTSGEDPFERMAVRRLIEDMVGEQTSLTDAIMEAAGPAGDKAPAHAVTAWASDHAETVRHVRRSLEEVEKSSGGWSFAKLTIANGALRELAAA
jgi:glutamate dehydrogenase